jgi:hypothetical protein
LAEPRLKQIRSKLIWIIELEYSQIFSRQRGALGSGLARLAKTLVSRQSQGEASGQLASLAKTLDEILSYTTVNYKCFVPHDMIYGILSLAHTGNFPKELAPDYNLPHTKVYWEYFRFIAKHTGNLSLLSTSLVLSSALAIIGGSYQINLN